MLSNHDLTGCGSLRASCGFCVRPAARGQGVRCIPWLLISGPFCGSLAAVDRGQGVCLSWCRSCSQRLPWCVSCSSLLIVCGSSVGSCAVSALTVGKVSGSRSADHLGGASSLHGFSALSSSLFYRYLWGFYLSSIGLLSHTHIGIIYIIYTILCMMLFIVIQGMMIDSNSMNTQ